MDLMHGMPLRPMYQDRCIQLITGCISWKVEKGRRDARARVHKGEEKIDKEIHQLFSKWVEGNDTGQK